MAHFLHFRRADGTVTDGVNLDLVMSWSSGVTEKGEAYVILSFAVMSQDIVRGGPMQPWVMRLTGAERDQFLAAMLKL